MENWEYLFNCLLVQNLTDGKNRTAVITRRHQACDPVMAPRTDIGVFILASGSKGAQIFEASEREKEAYNENK